MVRILPLAAVHKKKDTLLGTFVLQMHYRLYIYEHFANGASS